MSLLSISRRSLNSRYRIFNYLIKSMRMIVTKSSIKILIFMRKVLCSLCVMDTLIVVLKHHQHHPSSPQNFLSRGFMVTLLPFVISLFVFFKPSFLNPLEVSNCFVPRKLITNTVMTINFIIIIATTGYNNPSIQLSHFI